MFARILRLCCKFYATFIFLLLSFELGSFEPPGGCFMTMKITLLVSALAVAIVTPTTLAQASTEARKNVTVHFAKGAYSANYYGRVEGYKYDVYNFYGKKGQKLRIELSGGNVDAYLFSSKLPDSVNLGLYSTDVDKTGAYTLPATGSYEIRVLQPRSQARQDKKPKYWLSLCIY